MITFLRKIRKSLNGSGNAKKYFVYAIGEITLVVIGILIALQVNNWNTLRQSNKQANSILREIVRNVESNIEEATLDKDRIENSIGSAQTLLFHFENGHGYHDSLIVHMQNIFRARYFNGTRSGYTVLKSQSSLNLVEDLNFAISIYFEESLEDAKHFMDALEESYDEHGDMLKKYFRYESFDLANRPRRIPKDFDSLNTEEDFINSLIELTESRYAAVGMLENFIERSNKLLDRLNTYLQYNHVEQG